MRGCATANWPALECTVNNNLPIDLDLLEEFVAMNDYHTHPRLSSLEITEPEAVVAK